MEYYTIFLFVLNVLFLTVIVYTLMTAMKDHKCVFGIKCCPTDMVNDHTSSGDYHIPLTYGPSPVYSSLKDPETITFQYHDSDYTSGPCFFKLLIHYNNLPTSGGTNYPYPTNIGPSSSYEISTTTDKGGSVYLQYYHVNTQFWNQSYKVVNKAIEEIIKQINPNDTINISSDTINSGFKYKANWFTRGGKTKITSDSTGPSPSYFTQFNKNRTLYLNSADADTEPHNPIHDWFDFKQSVKKGSKTNYCETDPRFCKCIDPGAKRLPPCTDSAFDKTKGGYPEDSGKYAINCSRATKSQPTSQDVGEAMISNHSLAFLGNGKGGFSSCTGTDCALYNKKLFYGGDTKFKDFANSAWSYDKLSKNLYGGELLFCGAGPSSKPTNMYTSTSAGAIPITSVADVGPSFSNSNVPNAQVDSKGRFTLGFN